MPGVYPHITYISPSSLKKFYFSREDYFLDYLLIPRRARSAQTLPMSAGSAFDSYVKNYLYKNVVGGDNAFYELDNLMAKTVDAPIRREATNVGKYIFEMYMRHGALADIMLDLEGHIGVPRMEVGLEGAVTKEMESVPFFGYPDLFFRHREGARVELDFKVNGFYSNWPPNPKKGFFKLLPGRTQHKDVFEAKVSGFTINAGSYLEDIDSDWADQLTIYAWMLGEDVGSKFVAAIDQICCNTKEPVQWKNDDGTLSMYPNIKIAQHRGVVSAAYQHKLYDKCKKMWRSLETNHIFDDLPLDQSQDKCKMLQDMHSNPQPRDEEFDFLINR